MKRYTANEFTTDNVTFIAQELSDGLGHPLQMSPQLPRLMAYPTLHNVSQITPPVHFAVPSRQLRSHDDILKVDRRDDCTKSSVGLPSQNPPTPSSPAGSQDSELSHTYHHRLPDGRWAAEAVLEDDSYEHGQAAKGKAWALAHTPRKPMVGSDTEPFPDYDETGVHAAEMSYHTRQIIDSTELDSSPYPTHEVCDVYLPASVATTITGHHNYQQVCIMNKPSSSACC